MMSVGRRSCCVQKDQPAGLLCVLCFLMVLGQAEHGFTLGKNVTLDFHRELESPNSNYQFIVLLDGSPNPFYEQNQINFLGLKPGQAGRFDVKEDQNQWNVTITISIKDVQPIDEGLYIVNIVEWNSETASSHSYQTYLNVTYPPGRADCHIEIPPNPSGDWLAVRCNATAGNDNTGYLMCYQNSKQVPYLEPVRHIDNYMTGLFWIDPTLELRCCSTYNPSDVDMESCNDFVWPSSDGSMSPDKPDLITKAWSSASPSVTDDDMDQHNGKSKELWGDPVIIGTLVVVSGLTFLFAAAAAAAAVYKYLKTKRDKTNRKSSPSRGRQTEVEEQPLGTEVIYHAPAPRPNHR